MMLDIIEEIKKILTSQQVEDKHFKFYHFENGVFMCNMKTHRYYFDIEFSLNNENAEFYHKLLFSQISILPLKYLSLTIEAREDYECLIGYDGVKLTFRQTN
jgi:hypothetical protein